VEITKIEPRWNEKYANTPDIIVEVDEKLSWEEVLWDAVPEADQREHTLLLSTNCDPWVRFVYIADPNGHHNSHGALGGPYHMTDGTIFNSKTGWSSRSGVVNRDYSDYLREEIVDVTIRLGQYSLVAGFHCYLSYIRDHPCWPEDLYLIRNEKYLSSEAYWTISCHPDEVRKPHVPTHAT
jgi:hypothetical protein